MRVPVVVVLALLSLAPGMMAKDADERLTAAAEVLADGDIRRSERGWKSRSGIRKSGAQRPAPGKIRGLDLP